MNVLSLFDGMSCGRIALDRVGIKVDKYYASEVDPHAITVTQKNWPDTIQFGDVTNWRHWDIDWLNIDLIIAGSPCQGFSLLGEQLAFDDPRSKLFLVFVDILNFVKTINPDVKFMLENVKMKPDNMKVINHYLGVEPVVINSNLVSAQSRTRYYWANWEFGQPNDTGTTYRDIIVDPGFKPSTARKGNPRPIVFTGDKFGCLTATYYKGIRSDGRPSLSRRMGVFEEVKASGDCRQLTPMECERLQTVPDNYTEGVSNTQRYKMLGNGWTVDVIAHIFRQLTTSSTYQKMTSTLSRTKTVNNIKKLRTHLNPSVYRPEPIKLPPMLAHKADAEIGVLIEAHYEMRCELHELRVIRDEMIKVIETVGFVKDVSNMNNIQLILELDKCMTFVKEAKAVL